MQDGTGEPQQLETDKEAIKRLAVSPDGADLAFVSDGSLWVRPSDPNASASASKLVDRGNPKAEIANYEWSADSSLLVFQLIDNSMMPERDIYYYADGGLQKHRVSRAFPGEETSRYTVGVVNRETGKKGLFERPDDKHPIWSYGLSGDGRQLFVNSSDMLVKEHTVYLYDVASGARETHYREYDPKHLRPDWKVAWAPNDEGLIILTDRDGYLHLYQQKKPGGDLQALTRGSWEIADLYVGDAKGHIYFLANESHPAERQLYRVPAGGGEIERVSAPQPGTHQPAFSPGMGYAATLFSSDDSPMDLYVIDLERKATTRVTQSPRPEFYQQTWANIGYVEFNSHVDGVPLIGRLSLPHDYDSSRRYPLIVGSVYSDSVRNQYGGRTSHPTWGLDQYLVAQGYIILNVNVRGSWGQGREHNQGLRHGYGVIDIEDLHSGVKYLVEKGYVDPERVGIWGSSYGGLMTMMSLFKKPGVYAA
ncbi:MAG: DPP IV N-terminal domain-containing protein, partial [Xanthomonadales bacterium]|nr:DPP IV N-terminal domain-containing protein [Xanthomonadales bacterium]